MFDLTLIGIGAGNPDHLTYQGAVAMRAADVILIPRKGADKADLAELRHQICDRVLQPDLQKQGQGPRLIEFDMPVRDASGGYRAGVDDWHDRIAAAWLESLRTHLRDDLRVAMLIWGDPSLYDSALRIAGRLDPAPTCHVVPGITALQALTAAHAIPLNDIGAPVVITTGRQLRDHGWPKGADRVAVMLDGGGAFQVLDPEAVEIWWGAYLGMDHELLISGPLSRVQSEILSTREVARDRHGWIMDIYLLARKG